jgi:hypothetical protein
MIHASKHFEYEPPVRTYRVGAICSHEGCATILSRYNPSRWCAVHESEARHAHHAVSRLRDDDPDDFNEPRRCTRCEQLKDAEDFYARRYVCGYRRETVCKLCTSRRHNEWQKARRAGKT